jgi:hypothetical protein
MVTGKASTRGEEVLVRDWESAFKRGGFYRALVVATARNSGVWQDSWHLKTNFGQRRFISLTFLFGTLEEKVIATAFIKFFEI